MVVQIICDGSYNESGLMGFSASVRVDGNEYLCSGNMGGGGDSTDAELLAILESLQHLSRVTKDFSKIKRIDIFSDSQNGLDVLKKSDLDLKSKNKDFNSVQLQLRSSILKYMKECTSDIFFHKVKAHVKNSEANEIEKKHNQIDILARDEMRELRKDFERRKGCNEDSNFYGVIVGTNPSDKLGMYYNEMGYKMASIGLHARICQIGLMPKGLEKTPYYLGIKRWSQESGVPMSNLVTEIGFDDGTYGDGKKSMQIGDRALGANGLDATLHKIYFNEHYKDSDPHGKYKKHSRNVSGAVSRLLLGYQKRVSVKKPTKNGFIESPSRFLLNVCIDKKLITKMKMSKLSHAFSEIMEIPSFSNVNDLKSSGLIDKDIMIRDNEKSAESLEIAY